MKPASKLFLRLPLIAATSAAFALLSTPPAVHAEPYNEDEWYDPTDWFDGNNYEYDDTYNYGSYGAGDYDYDDYNYGTGYTGYNAGNTNTGYQSSNTGYRDTGTSNSYWRDNYDYNYDAGRSGNRNQQQANQQNRQGQQGQKRTLAGTIDGFREVNVRNRQGARDRFTVVRLRMRDGRSATVDLGKRLTLQDVSLQKGDYITVSGQQRMISGQNVILADTINVDGQQHRITRGGQASTSSRSQQQQGRQGSNAMVGSGNETLRGTIESFRRVNVQGSPAGHTLAKVTMENGESQIVDFGPNQTPASLGISNGDYVSVRGQRTQINNRQILNAQSVYADGSWRNIRQINWWNNDNQQGQGQSQ